MREMKFRGRIMQGNENAGHWVYWGLNGTGMLDAIDPDTIGQYTGKEDSNGKEIYQGDIQRWSNPLKSKEEYAKNPYSSCVVEWNDNRAGFNMVYGGGTEVIGNIYENPELMEEKK